MSKDKSHTDADVARAQQGAHDVRNHLSGILAGARLIARRSGDPQFIEEIAAMIEKEVIAATQVLKQMVEPPRDEPGTNSGE